MFHVFLAANSWQYLSDLRRWGWKKKEYHENNHDIRRDPHNHVIKPKCVNTFICCVNLPHKSVWSAEEPQATSHLRHPVLLKSDCCVKRPLLTTKAERWRETVMMEAVMEFQWGYLPEVDGRESHWESKSCDCSVLPCRHGDWWDSDLRRHDQSVFECT